MPTLTAPRTTLASISLAIAIVAAGASVALAQEEPAGAGEPLTASFDFEADEQGWVPIVADLPEGYDPEVGDLLQEWMPLPEGLEGNALYSQGANQSDDLFMGWWSRVDGLTPGTEYLVEATLVMASNMPAAIADEPNSPAQVWVKLGAIDRQLEAVADDGWLRLNADKGAASEGGRDAVVLGTIANPDLELGEDFRTFALHDLGTDDVPVPLTVTPSEDGSVWLFMGTDSGYAGFTTQFYDAVELTLTPR